MGTLSIDAFTTGASATTDLQRFIYNSADGNLFYDSDGVGSNTQVLIAILTSNLALTNQDIVVF